MATHSSTLAWRIPWTKEPGGLQSMGRRDMIKRLTLFQVRAAGLLGPDQGGAQVSVASDE